jgi:hypothetical protein
VNEAVTVSLPLIDIMTPTTIHLETSSPFSIHAATLVDMRTGDFQQLQPSPYQRILSSDIELYENDAVLPRAFLVSEARFVPDDDVGSEMALEGMRDQSFDPAAVVYISGEVLDGISDVGAIRESPLQSASVTEYSPTRVIVNVHADAPALLLLTDAYYPGWTATVNGEPADVRRADVMFRAVFVPAGESTIVFEYRPMRLPAALIAGGIGWLMAAVWVAARFRQSSVMPS